MIGRVTYLVLGWAAVALGAIGVVLPVLPTTPFIILAAFLFTKGSPRARAWLIEHGHFGPLIRDWEEQRAIPPYAKKLAVGMMAAVFAVSLIFGAAWWVLAIQAGCMGPAALFVWTRPDPTT